MPSSLAERSAWKHEGSSAQSVLLFWGCVHCEVWASLQEAGSLQHGHLGLQEGTCIGHAKKNKNDITILWCHDLILQRSDSSTLCSCIPVMTLGQTKNASDVFDKLDTVHNKQFESVISGRSVPKHPWCVCTKQTEMAKVPLAHGGAWAPTACQDRPEREDIDC